MRIGAGYADVAGAETSLRPVGLQYQLLLPVLQIGILQHLGQVQRLVRRRLANLLVDLLEFAAGLIRNGDDLARLKVQVVTHLPRGVFESKDQLPQIHEHLFQDPGFSRMGSMVVILSLTVPHTWRHPPGQPADGVLSSWVNLQSMSWNS